MLNAGMRNKKGEQTSAWLKTAGPRCPQVWTNDDKDDKDRDLHHVLVEDEDVVAECLGYLRNPLEGVENICVFSKSEQQFVTTFDRRDVNFKEADDAVPEVPHEDEVPAGGEQPRPRVPEPGVRQPRVAQPGGGRGSRYKTTAKEPLNLVANPSTIWEAFKELTTKQGGATVAEVAAMVEGKLAGDPNTKDLVASYASRFKAMGLLEKE